MHDDCLRLVINNNKRSVIVLKHKCAKSIHHLLLMFARLLRLICEYHRGLSIPTKKNDCPFKLCHVSNSHSPWPTCIPCGNYGYGTYTDETRNPLRKWSFKLRTPWCSHRGWHRLKILSPCFDRGTRGAQKVTFHAHFLIQISLGCLCEIVVSFLFCLCMHPCFSLYVQPRPPVL